MNVLANGVVAVLVGAIALVFVYAVRRRNVAAAVNALFSLGVAGVAVGVATWSPANGGSLFALDLALWSAVAGLLHSVGMLGIYDSVWWYDHVTHTVSAALLAALVYAAALVTVGDSAPIAVVAVGTVGYIFAAGMVWEGVELVARAVGERYDVEPVLVHYGWRDTAYDLLFDVVGAVLVVAFDVRRFVGLAAEFPDATRTVFVWTASAFTAGSVLVVVGVLWQSGERWV